MSTSPSWFDQEKFSRLVKKVSPKTTTEPLPSLQSLATDTSVGENANAASTSRISLVSKPPSLLSEHRALPTLPRRTSPLPSLKPIFAFPVSTAKGPAPAAVTAPAVEVEEKEEIEPKDEIKEEVKDDLKDQSRDKPDDMILPDTRSEEEESALAETWHKMGLLNEELARAIHERDQALNEGTALREQLRKADDMLKDHEEAPPASDVARLAKERDAAMAELQVLKNQSARKTAPIKDLRSPTQSQELILLTEERDQARKQYFAIRKEFEHLKYTSTTGVKGTGIAQSLGVKKDNDKELEALRLQLSEKDREILALKAAAAEPVEPAPPAVPVEDEKMKAEIAAMREQLTRAKEEASIAQRGLALSQKALHETRDTLREATEGTSLSRHNFDNLKNECATLSQQNAVLQSKNDQLLKDIAAAKKGTGRLGM